MGSNALAPKPPPGFEIDEIPSPPAGFTLDVPKPPQGFVVDNIPDVEGTPQPEVSQKSWGEAFDVGVVGMAEAIDQTAIDIASLVPKAMAYLATAIATGDRERAKQAFEKKYNYTLPSTQPEAKQRYMEGISLIFKPISKAAEFVTPTGKPEDYPEWENIADMPGPVHPIQRDIQRGLTELGFFEAAAKGARKVLKTKTEIKPEIPVAELEKADAQIKEMALRGRAKELLLQSMEAEHLAKHPQLKASIGEKIRIAEKIALEEIKKRTEETLDDIRMTTQPPRVKHPGAGMQKVDMGERGVGYVLKDITGGIKDPIIQQELKNSIFNPDEFAGVPPQGAPHPGVAPGMPERVGPQPTGSAFTRGRTTVERPTTVEPAVAEQAVGQLAELHRKFVQSTKPPVGVDTSADMGKMGRFKYGERIPGQPPRPTGEGVIPTVEPTPRQVEPIGKAPVIPVEKATPQEVAVEVREKAAVRPGKVEAVAEKGAKIKKPAAGKITDATKVNDLTMGDILSEVRRGSSKAVVKELGSILKEQGKEYYQDIMNPGKIGARIWQDLKEEGVPSKEAKIQVNKMLQDIDYEGNYNRILKGEKPAPKEFTRTDKAVEQKAQEIVAVTESLVTPKEGYIAEGKRATELRKHDFFSEMPDGEIPKWVTMSIEHMTPKELRRFLEAMDKEGKFDWGQVSEKEMAEYASAKYGRYAKVEPETFIEVRGKGGIEYGELEKAADIASAYKSDIGGTTLDFLGLQSTYESVARLVRNARIKKEKYSAQKAYETRKRIDKTAKDIWGKGADKEINRVKKQLFGENIPTDKLAMNDLKKLELGIGELRRQVGETKGGSPTKVARKGKTKETTVYEDQANAIKGAEELTDTFMRRLSRTDKGWGISLLETHGLRIFREIGEPIKKLFYDRITDGDKLATQRFKAHVAEMDKITKGISRAEEQRITKYAISKQKGGIEALKEQGETVPTWEELSPKEQAAYDWMRKGYEQFYKDVNVARVRAGLEPFPKQPDYFTFWNRLHNAFDKGLSFEEISFKHISKETPFPYRKRRIGKQELWLNGFDIYKTYAERAFRHEELTPIIAHCREMLFKMDDGYKLSEFKPNTHTYLSEWLNTASGAPVISKYPQVAAIGKMLNENIAAAVLAYNIRSAMIQWTAIVNTYSRLGEVSVAKGMAVFFDDAISQFVEKHSNVINREFDVHARDIISAARERRKKITAIGMKPLQWMDKQTAKWTWYSAYESALKDGLKGKEAIRFADDIVTETQASAKEYELSPIQRSVAGKTVTLFQTFVINQFNYLTKEVLGYKNPRVSKVEAAQRTMRWILGATVINTIFEDLLGINSPFPAPFNRFVEERKKGKKPIVAAARAASEMLDLVPLLSSLRYGSSPGGPVLELGQEIGEIISDKPGPKTAILEIAGKARGWPGTAQIAKTAKRLSWGSSLPAALIGAGKRKPKKRTGGRTRSRAR